MPGAWLGENEIPDVSEVSPGVFEFGFYRNANVRTRVAIFTLVFAFASVICGTGLVLFWGEWRAFAFLVLFYAFVSLTFFFAIFRSSICIIDTQSRRLARNNSAWARSVSSRTGLVRRNCSSGPKTAMQMWSQCPRVVR